MALNVDEIRKRNLELKRKMSGGGGAHWRPKEGENIIRVLTFTHKITKEDVALGLFPKDRVGKVIEDFEREVIRQFGFTDNNAPIFSTKKSLGMYDELKNSKDGEDKVRAKEIRPNRVYAVNIIDMNDPEKGVQLFLAPISVRTVIGDHIEDADFGIGIIGLTGRDFKVTYTKDAKPAEIYKVIIRDKDKCKKLGSKVQEMTKDLYDPKIYEGFAKRLNEDEIELPVGSAGDPEVEGESTEVVGEREEEAASNGKQSKKSSIFDE